jgi:hypothetical protein
VTVFIVSSGAMLASVRYYSKDMANPHPKSIRLIDGSPPHRFGILFSARVPGRGSVVRSYKVEPQRHSTRFSSPNQHWICYYPGLQTMGSKRGHLISDKSFVRPSGPGPRSSWRLFHPSQCSVEEHLVPSFRSVVSGSSCLGLSLCQLARRLIHLRGHAVFIQ